MGAKSLYLDNRKKYQEQIRLANDLKALCKLQKGFERYNLYKSKWAVLDLDELVEKLFVNPTYTNTGQKFEITDENSRYVIYCDNSASYFRIGDKSIPRKHKGHYLGADLKSVLNEIVNGRIVGTSNDRRQQLSHFKMKIVKRGK